MQRQSVAFDRAAHFYDETRGFPPGIEQDAARTIVTAGGLTGASQALEIGVGTGRIALPVAKHITAYYGLDLSAPMLLRLRTKLKDESIYLTQADATQLPYADDSFDAVVAVHVFHLIPNWRTVINELERVLKPNAPVIHCWSEQDEVFKVLWDAWRAAIPDEQAEDVGLRWEKNEGFLTELGWRPMEAQHFSYRSGRSPAVFAEQLRNRIWSRTWRLTEDALALGVAAVEGVIAEQYANPESELEVESRFMAKAYYPPNTI